MRDGSLETWWEVFYQRGDFYLKRGRNQQVNTLLKRHRRLLETPHAKTKCTQMLVNGNLCRYYWGRISPWSNTCIQRLLLPLITFAWCYKKGRAGLASKRNCQSGGKVENLTPFTRITLIKHQGLLMIQRHRFNQTDTGTFMDFLNWSIS